jgi:hypothetical protein
MDIRDGGGEVHGIEGKGRDPVVSRRDGCDGDPDVLSIF